MCSLGSQDPLVGDSTVQVYFGEKVSFCGLWGKGWIWGVGGEVWGISWNGGALLNSVGWEGQV